jgi:hypothetical protein
MRTSSKLFLVVILLIVCYFIGFSFPSNIQFHLKWTKVNTALLQASLEALSVQLRDNRFLFHTGYACGHDLENQSDSGFYIFDLATTRIEFAPQYSPFPAFLHHSFKGMMETADGDILAIGGIHSAPNATPTAPDTYYIWKRAANGLANGSANPSWAMKEAKGVGGMVSCSMYKLNSWPTATR